jgi:hypothetical protein
MACNICYGNTTENSIISSRVVTNFVTPNITPVQIINSDVLTKRAFSTGPSIFPYKSCNTRAVMNSAPCANGYSVTTVYTTVTPI